MIAEIVSVGTELLMGQVVNTDAQFIASRLAPLGYQVFYHITVGDNPKRLTEAIHTAIGRADVVVFTGGLGPTDDDLTKETVAAALGLMVEPIPEQIEHLTKLFTEKGRQMAPNNIKQACFPKSAIILPNPNGTAPGCIMESDGKAAILLPGPPRELFPMFENHAMPYLEARCGTRLYSREMRIFGLGESDLTYRIRDIIAEQTNPTVAPYAKPGEVTLRITAKCASKEEGEALVLPMMSEIIDRIGDVVYSTNGKTLPEVCAHLLLEKGKTLAVAESLTGGMVTSALIDVPGASAFLLEGCVTYSDKAKAARLRVKPETLSTYGAVSAQCAKEMAEGMRNSAASDYALATTGFAGPDGGTPDCPIGTVFLALASAEGTEVKKLVLYGGRARIRQAAMLNALDILRRKLYTQTNVRDILNQ